MIVLGCTADYGLGRGVASKLGLEYRSTAVKAFPDGELYVRVPKIRDDAAIVVQAMPKPQEKMLFEMLMAVDALKDVGVEHVHVLIPYLAYARQDRAFMEGEAVSARVMLHAIKSAGVEKLAVVEPHKDAELAYFEGNSSSIQVLNVVAGNAIKSLKNPFLIAPDVGIVPSVKAIAEANGIGWLYIDKERDKQNGSISMKEKPEADLRGFDALVIDDMISTGGTIRQAAMFAREAGAFSVSAAATHLVIAGDAEAKLWNSGISKLFGANTLEYKKCTSIDVSGHVTEGLRNLLRL